MSDCALPGSSGELYIGDELAAAEAMAALMLGGSGPATVRMQPEPDETRVARLNVKGEPVTAIMRFWKPGDSGPTGRCRLCDRCAAYGDRCLMVVRGNFTRESAALYSTRGLREHGAPVVPEVALILEGRG